MSIDTQTRAMNRPRAVTRPITVDDDTRTVVATISTGAAVYRVGARPDGTYGPWLEQLDLQRAVLPGPGQAPILADHDATSESILGVVETISKEAGRLEAVLRFGSAPRAQRYFDDIRDGLRAGVSIGYATADAERIGDDRDEPVFLITPDIREISLVPIGADRAALIRSDNPSKITRFRKMDIANRAGTVPADTASLDALAAERERVSAILASARALNVDVARIEHLLVSDTPLAEARAQIVDLVAARQAPQVFNHLPMNEARSSTESLLEDISTAWAHRLNPAVPLTGRAREIRGMRTASAVAEILRARGERVPSSERAIITRAGSLTTSDLPLILANSATKALLPAFQAQKSALVEVASLDSTRDFKAATRHRLSEFPALKKVLEHGEYTYGPLSEIQESFRLNKYGRIVSVTWESLVNDDLGALSDAIRNAARAAATLEADLLATAVTSNPAMADSVAVYHNTHGNLAAVNAVISVANLSIVIAMMRKQTNIDGNIINIAPKYLVVPASLEAIALQVVSDISPSTVTDSNAAIRNLHVVVEPRLDASSATSWYVFASQATAPTLSLAHLEGEEGPQVTSRDGFEVDAVQLKVRHVAAAYWADFRGTAKNIGV